MFLDVLCDIFIRVSFEQELGHTRLYLELEQLRYEDALQVRYDLNCTQFRIPILTLQPLVENAVRHGVRGYPDHSGRSDLLVAEGTNQIQIWNNPGVTLPNTGGPAGWIYK